MKQQLKALEAKIKETPSLRNNLKSISRFMDSLLVLFGVALLTFLIVRLDIHLSGFKPVLLIALFGLSFASLSFKKLRQKLFYVGLVAVLFMIFQPLPTIFLSLKEPSHSFLETSWKLFFFPLLYIGLWFLYSARSFFSKNKIFLSALGLCFLLFVTNSVFSKVGNALSVKVKETNQQVQFCSIQKCKIQDRTLLQSPDKSLQKAKLELAVCRALSWPFNFAINFKNPISLKAGDPLADLRLNPSVHPEALLRETKRLGLDQPMWKQFLLWLDGIVVRGDFGLTHQGEPVLDAIKTPLRNTLLLNILVLLFTWLIAVPLGVVAAINKNKIADRLLLSLSSMSITTPTFLLTIFILSLAVKLSIGEIGGLTSADFDEMNYFAKIFDIAKHLILPISILTFVSIGGLIRQMRGNLLDVLNEDYIKAARARGISEARIFWGHALQNAINPLITLLGFEFAALVSGAALMEMILAYPGIGALTIEAARRPDINLLMFNLLLGTIMLMLGNALADWLLRKVDPRITA